MVASSSNRTIRIWDLAAGELTRTLQGQRDAVRSVCPVTVDGRQLLACVGNDQTVRIWDPATAKVHAFMRGEGILGSCAQIRQRSLPAGRRERAIPVRLSCRRHRTYVREMNAKATGAGPHHSTGYWS